MRAKRATEVALHRRWALFLPLVFVVVVGCQGPAGQPATVESTSTAPRPAPSATPVFQVGHIELMATEHGTYYHYLPSNLTVDSPLVVLVHGTPGHDESAADAARYYVEHWQAWADRRAALLVAPAFDQENFSSKDGEQALGGYRGLFGREIGADRFVLDIVDRYRHLAGGGGDRFYLYGHSAGGQFAARFLVTHPERLHAVVISAAVIYPQPDPTVPWPYGLGPLEGTLHWLEPAEDTPVSVAPDEATWLAGLALPATVIVGLNDLEPQPTWPGQKGNNRVVRARHWVEDMKTFAAAHGADSRLSLSLVPNAGHGAAGLVTYCQDALLPPAGP